MAIIKREYRYSRESKTEQNEPTVNKGKFRVESTSRSLPRIFDISSMIPNRVGKLTRRGTSEAVNKVTGVFYHKFGKARNNGRGLNISFNIGLNILEEMNIKEEKPRFVLLHHPENKKKLILALSPNGNICTKQNPYYLTFTSAFDYLNGWIPDDNDIRNRKDLEFEVYENAIVVTGM